MSYLPDDGEYCVPFYVLTCFFHDTCASKFLRTGGQLFPSIFDFSRKLIVAEFFGINFSSQRGKQLLKGKQPGRNSPSHVSYHENC